MADEERLRAGDDDRDAAAAALREAHARGRLDPEEYHARLDAVFTARTLGELARLTADLPEGRPLARREPPAGDVAGPLLAATAVAVVLLVLTRFRPVVALPVLLALAAYAAVLLARSRRGGG